MIRITQLHKYFNRGTDAEIHALDNVSLEIHSGQYLVLLGANGSGKSTLLNLLAGNEIPSTGNILFDDKDVTQLPDYRRSNVVSRIFQDPLAGTAPGLSIVENFRLAAIRSKTKRLTIGIDKQFRSLVQNKVASLGLGLEKKVDNAMGTLSGGQRQALTLLMAVMDDTKLLLMDEPASALDPKTAERIMELSDRLIRENKLTAILVTHRIKDAVVFADRIVHLEEGKIRHDLSGEAKRKLKTEEIYSWF